MKSISIHKIEDELMALIQKKAREKGLSLNKTIKLLLREALGLSQVPAEEKRKNFEVFSGIWNAEDLQEFEESVSDFNQVDPDDWK